MAAVNSADHDKRVAESKRSAALQGCRAAVGRPEGLRYEWPPSILLTMISALRNQNVAQPFRAAVRALAGLKACATSGRRQSANAFPQKRMPAVTSNRRAGSR